MIPNSMLFFFCGALPPLYPGVRLEMDSFQFIETATENLTDAQMGSIYQVQEYIDIQNIRRFLKGQQIDLRGLKSEKDLEDAIALGEGFPEVVHAFFSEFESTKEQLEKYPLLLSNYLNMKVENSSGFLREFFEREYQLNLCLVAMRCSQGMGDISHELRFEDSKDTFVAQLLVQKDGGAFVFPYEWEHLNDPLSNAKEPIDQYRVLLEEKYNYAMDYCANNTFTLGYALAYFTALIALEEYEALDEQQGTSIIEGLA